MEGQKQGVAIAEKVLKSIRREIEEKGVKLSTTQGGKEGKHKERARRKKCDVRFSFATRTRVFQKHNMVGARKLLRMGFGLCAWGGQAVGIFQQVAIEETFGGSRQEGIGAVTSHGGE